MRHRRDGLHVPLVAAAAAAAVALVFVAAVSAALGLPRPLAAGLAGLAGAAVLSPSVSSVAAGFVTFAFVLASGLISMAAWRDETRVGAALPFLAGAISTASCSLGVFLMYLTPATEFDVLANHRVKREYIVFADLRNEEASVLVAQLI